MGLDVADRQKVHPEVSRAISKSRFGGWLGDAGYLHSSCKSNDLGKRFRRNGLLSVTLEHPPIAARLQNLDEKSMHAGGQGRARHRRH